jgi:hypothetical protein
MSGKGIGCGVLVTRVVVDLVAIVCQELQPAHLLTVQDVRFCEVFQVLMVHQDMDW